MNQLVKYEPNVMPLAAAKQVATVSKPLMNINVYQEGSKIHATGTLISNGNVQVFQACFDMAPVLAEYAKNNPHRVSGFFDDIVSTVKKIGRTKVVRAVANAGKAVIRSDISKAATGALAIAIPPVGIPAAAAFAGANIALDQIERGTAAVSEADKLMKQVKNPKRHVILPNGKRAIAVSTRLSPKPLMVAPATVEKKFALLQQDINNKHKVQERFAEIAQVAKINPPPGNPALAKKVDDAKRQAKVIKLVAKNKAAINNMKAQAKGGEQGTLITTRGFERGKFARTNNSKVPMTTFLGKNKKALKGRFLKVGCCL